MVKHIVLWKLKETAGGRSRAENAALIKKVLEELRGVIPGLLEIEVGVDFLHSEQSADVAPSPGGCEAPPLEHEAATRARARTSRLGIIEALSRGAALGGRWGCRISFSRFDENRRRRTMVA